MVVAEVNDTAMFSGKSEMRTCFVLTAGFEVFRDYLP